MREESARFLRRSNPSQRLTFALADRLVEVTRLIINLELPPLGFKPLAAAPIIQHTAHDSPTRSQPMMRIALRRRVPVPPIRAGIERLRRGSVKDDAEAVKGGAVAEEGDVGVCWVFGEGGRGRGRGSDRDALFVGDGDGAGVGGLWGALAVSLTSLQE